MTTITKERLEQIVHAAGLEPCDYEDVFDGIKTGEIVKMARMLLAGMEQEPVAWLNDAYLARGVVDGEAGSEGAGPGYIPAYREPVPQPDAERAELESLKAQLKAAQAHITELEMAPPAPVEPGEEPVPVMPDFPGKAMTQRECWQAGKAFGLAEARNSPVIPEGYALVPVSLTAENGAKACLLGEFSETTSISCPECLGAEECETCDGSGAIKVELPVSWTNIKAIWARGVEHFAAAPQQEVKS